MLLWMMVGGGVLENSHTQETKRSGPHEKKSSAAERPGFIGIKILVFKKKCASMRVVVVVLLIVAAMAYLGYKLTVGIRKRRDGRPRARVDETGCERIVTQSDCANRADECKWNPLNVVPRCTSIRRVSHKRLQQMRVPDFWK